MPANFRWICSCARRQVVANVGCRWGRGDGCNFDHQTAVVVMSVPRVKVRRLRIVPLQISSLPREGQDRDRGVGPTASQRSCCSTLLSLPATIRYIARAIRR
jgi:hypothetical protein